MKVQAILSVCIGSKTVVGDIVSFVHVVHVSDYDAIPDHS
jgi:hypothetical protein